jgi:hypothetical protein
MGRLFAGLFIVALFQPPTAHATTANSLSGRVVIDGVLDEYSPDEWVLDESTNPEETDRDSQWSRDNDISRVALTWDRSFLYIGVEGRAFDSFLSLFIFNRAGGLTSLEDAGEFRRAIQLPSPINLMALAAPGRIPDVARADDTHPFGLLDRGAAPVAISGDRTGPVGFEMKVPWSMLTLSRPVSLVAAVTGELGTGAGDVAPDASAVMDTDRFARAVLDRWFQIDADIDDDGLADIGISPRTAGRVQTYGLGASKRSDYTVGIEVAPRAFAPDRSEPASINVWVNGNIPQQPLHISVTIYSLEGERVKVLADDLGAGGGSILPVSWNGTDEHGDIVRGGTYIIVADWGYNRGEHVGRAKTAVVVAR